MHGREYKSNLVRSQTQRSETQIFLSPHTTFLASWHSYVRPYLDKSSKSQVPRTENEIKY